jgi:hypothetical protein
LLEQYENARVSDFFAKGKQKAIPVLEHGVGSRSGYGFNGCVVDHNPPVFVSVDFKEVKAGLYLSRKGGV